MIASQVISWHIGSLIVFLFFILDLFPSVMRLLMYWYCCETVEEWNPFRILCPETHDFYRG